MYVLFSTFAIVKPKCCFPCLGTDDGTPTVSTNAPCLEYSVFPPSVGNCKRPEHCTGTLKSSGQCDLQAGDEEGCCINWKEIMYVVSPSSRGQFRINHIHAKSQQINWKSHLNWKKGIEKNGFKLYMMSSMTWFNWEMNKRILKFAILVGAEKSRKDMPRMAKE